MERFHCGLDFGEKKFSPIGASQSLIEQHQILTIYKATCFFSQSNCMYRFNKCNGVTKRSHWGSDFVDKKNTFESSQSLI